MADFESDAQRDFRLDRESHERELRNMEPTPLRINPNDNPIADVGYMMTVASLDRVAAENFRQGILGNPYHMLHASAARHGLFGHQAEGQGPTEEATVAPRRRLLTPGM